LHKFFLNTLQEAKAQYPKEKDKKSRLDSLFQETEQNPNIANSFTKYKISCFDKKLINTNFYIAWTDNKGENTHTKNFSRFEELVQDEISFSEEDRPKKGMWILAWYKTEKGKPDRRYNPRWVFIDEIIPEAIELNETNYYSKVAIQRTDLSEDPNRVLQAPFQLTPSITKAFFTAITDPDIGKYLIQGESDALWSLEKSLPGVPALVEKMAKILNSQSKQT